MGESKRGITTAEMHAAMDERIERAMMEAGMFVGMFMTTPFPASPGERDDWAQRLANYAETRHHAGDVAVGKLIVGILRGLHAAGALTKLPQAPH